MHITHCHTVLVCLFCLFLHSIAAGIVVEYFIVVVQTTGSSYPAEQSQSECVTIVTIMCWACHRGSIHLTMCYSTTTHELFLTVVTSDLYTPINNVKL